MTNHMIKTTKEWQATSMLNKIIERGILCIEIGIDDQFYAKVGDGRRSYKNLPYLFNGAFDDIYSKIETLETHINEGLNDRYTKEEIDTIQNELKELIQHIDLSDYVTNDSLHEYTQSFTQEEKDKLASLENVDISEIDERVKTLESIDHSLYATVDYVNEQIENVDVDLSNYITQDYFNETIENIKIDVDLDDYATITYVDEKISEINIPEIDLSMYATKSWVSTQIANIPGMDLTGYATEQYVDDAINAIPEHTLPIASSSTLGGVKIGNNIDINNGVISVTFPEETEYIDGNDIKIVDNGDGTKTINWIGTMPTITTGNGLSVTNYHITTSAVLDVDNAENDDYHLEVSFADGSTKMVNLPEYTLPIASDETLGGVIIGDNINVTSDGTISVDLPKPSSFYTPGDGISIGNMTLSEDFEYLSFIQFNGGTVFDTGEIHKAHDKFEIDFECTNINGDTLFDSRSYNVEANAYGVHILDNGVVYLNRSSPSYAPVYDNSFKLELNGQYKLITQDMTMSIYDYETNELLEETSTAPSDMFLDDGLYTMTLGNIHNRAHYHHANEFGYYKLFRFKWYRDNELIHDFIPARRNTDNVVGLYDSVTGTMITPGYQNSYVPMTYGTIIDPDSLIDFSINVTPATTTEIGGIIVGRGLTIDEDGVLDVEFPEYNNTTYEAGSGISIQEADHLASLGYRRLDYIDSNGQQYIDTGFVPSNNTTIVIDSIPHTAGHSITNNVTLFGTMLDNAYNADEWMFWCYSGGSEAYQNQGCPGVYCRGQNNAITLTGVNFETRCTITASTSHRNITIDYPDGTSITRSPTNTNAFSTPVNTLYLFHSNTESVPVPLRKTYTRMYSCQIFDNNVLLMDLIPAQRISDDKVGMYDIQNDQFYTSQTDVEFIAGTAHEGSVNNQISITPATTTAIGGVIIGEGINVTQDGTISVDQSIIPDVPEELGVMDLQVKQNEVGVLTSTKPNNVTEDLDVLQYLGVLTLNVGFTPGQEVPLG